MRIVLWLALALVAGSAQAQTAARSCFAIVRDAPCDTLAMTVPAFPLMSLAAHRDPQ